MALEAALSPIARHILGPLKMDFRRDKEDTIITGSSEYVGQFVAGLRENQSTNYYTSGDVCTLESFQMTCAKDKVHITGWTEIHGPDYGIMIVLSDKLFHI